MRRFCLSVVGFALIVLGAPSLASATPVTCPSPPAGSNLYTVDPAIDCVWGDTPQLGNAQDDFLDGLGTNDAAYGTVFTNADANDERFNMSWTLIGSTVGWGAEYEAFAGLTFTDTNNGNLTTWTVTDTDYTSYALGIKDGDAPKWAIFLLDGLTGTASMTDGSFSHFTLYGSNTPIPSDDGDGDGDGGGDGSQEVPEPASLLMFGAGVGAAAFGFRRRNRKAGTS